MHLMTTLTELLQVEEHNFILRCRAEHLNNIM